MLRQFVFVNDKENKYGQTHNVDFNGILICINNTNNSGCNSISIYE